MVAPLVRAVNAVKTGERVMFVVSDEDRVAVCRAHMSGGWDGALVELRRRYLGLTDRTAPRVLDWVLAMLPLPGRAEQK